MNIALSCRRLRKALVSKLMKLLNKREMEGTEALE